MRLWIEGAHQCLARTGEDVCADAVRTFQTEDQFFAILASSSRAGKVGRDQATQLAGKAVAMARQGAPLDALAATALAALPRDEHMPFSVLRVLERGEARLVECNAPPFFLIQDGELALLPVLEEVRAGRLIRRCQFLLHDGDHMAMVSEGYLRPRGWRWGWPDVAVAVKRWTDTGCDADELLGALVRTYRRLNPETPREDVTVVAMHARPARTATVWTGPPADQVQDEAALNKLMAEEGVRIICGDTTAEIAARLLGSELEMEPRPDHGWAEVPPTSRLDGVDLVTEGLVTLGKARERMARARLVSDLPRQEDGATHLARALLAADKVRFIVGLAVNPVQADDSGTPLRRGVVEELVRDLEGRGKIASLEYL